MIDVEFEVCFEFLRPVMLAKRRLQRVLVRVYLPVPNPGEGAQKKIKKWMIAHCLVHVPV
jgi:hypothetical protein